MRPSQANPCLKCISEQEVKEQTKGKNISRQDAEALIIKLAEDQGHHPYTGKVTTRSLAEYFKINPDTCQYLLSKAFSNSPRLKKSNPPPASNLEKLNHIKGVERFEGFDLFNDILEL